MSDVKCDVRCQMSNVGAQRASQNKTINSGRSDIYSNIWPVKTTRLQRSKIFIARV